MVQDAVKLFEADCARKRYVPARTQLAAFVGKAKKQLLVYDPKVSAPAIVRLLKERMKAGVDVRIIGKVGGKGHDLIHQKYPGRRLHGRQPEPSRARARQAARSGPVREKSGAHQGDDRHV